MPPMVRVNGEMSLRNDMIMRNVLYAGWLKRAKSASFLYISVLLARLRHTFECLRERKFRQGKGFLFVCFVTLSGHISESIVSNEALLIEELLY